MCIRLLVQGLEGERHWQRRFQVDIFFALLATSFAVKHDRSYYPAEFFCLTFERILEKSKWKRFTTFLGVADLVLGLGLAGNKISEKHPTFPARVVLGKGVPLLPQCS